MLVYIFSGDQKSDKSLSFVLEDILASKIYKVRRLEPFLFLKGVPVYLNTSTISLFEMRHEIIPQYALDSSEVQLDCRAISEYIVQIDPIVNQLRLNNSEKYRLVYHLVTKQSSENESRILTRIEIIRELIEHGQIDATKLINSACQAKAEKNQTIPEGCIATYEQMTNTVTICCGSKRNIGRYKQVVGQANRVLKFSKIELVLE